MNNINLYINKGLRNSFRTKINYSIICNVSWHVDAIVDDELRINIINFPMVGRGFIWYSKIYN